MSRRRTLLAVSFLVPLSAALAWSPRSQQAVPYQPRRVSGPVYFLEGGAGGNVAAAIGEGGVVLVDDQFEVQAPLIRKALQEIGAGPVRYLINTHWHGDHTGGNASFSDTATIVAHDLVRERLSHPQKLSRGDREAAPPAAWPVVTFNDRVTIHAGGQTIQLRHYEHAHTDGDSVVWFEEAKVLHTGDLFFNGIFPFIDTETGGSVAGLVRALNQILEWLPEEARVIPGHGPLGDSGDLRAYRDMLVDCQTRIQRALADGQSADDMLADGLLDDYDSWSWQFIDTEAFLRTLVDEASR